MKYIVLIIVLAAMVGLTTALTESVTITAPNDGDVFEQGQTIKVSVEISSISGEASQYPNGQTSQARLYLNDNPQLTGTFNTPDAPLEPGEYTLEERVIDESGAVVSDFISFEIVEPIHKNNGKHAGAKK